LFLYRVRGKINGAVHRKLKEDIAQ